MSSFWALQLTNGEAAHAARLRLLPRIEVCQLQSEVWLRGPQGDNETERQLRLLPAGQRFVVLDDLQLVPLGQLVPQGVLPVGPWSPLEAWMMLQLPVAHFAANQQASSPLEVVRDDRERVPNLLITTISIWHEYATTAPLVRLEHWHFAVADDGRVLVRGTPLPSIPGERYVEDHGLATAAGWRWSPAVESTVLRELLQLAPHDLAIWKADGTWELIAAGDFVKASRSAVRQSAAGGLA